MDSFLGDLFNDGQLSPVLLVPVLFVIVGAILVFTLGFKKPKEPQFKKIAASDANAKKTKRKEKQPTSVKPTIVKPTPNGNVATPQPPAVKKPPQPAAVAAPKPPKPDSQKTKEQSSPKKSVKTATSKKPTAPKPEKVRKPADFDDGEWTKVPSRTDKKKKLDDLLIAQVLDSAVPKKPSAKAAVDPTKPTKNTKQLKDEENKVKKEAAKVNKKVKAVADNTENNQDRIPIVAQSAEIIPVPAKTEPFVVAEEKSDDNKQVAAGIVFDEMGDTWTEAKAPKKGKKKSRKE